MNNIIILLTRMTNLVNEPIGTLSADNIDEHETTEVSSNASNLRHQQDSNVATPMREVVQTLRFFGVPKKVAVITSIVISIMLSVAVYMLGRYVD